MPRIEYLDIDEHILEKIEVEHGVTWEEVVEACWSSRAKMRRTRSGLFKLYGRSDAGRYLFVIVPARCGWSSPPAT